MIALSQTDKTPKLTSVVSESIPHLKRGAMRDFKTILKEHGYWRDKNWNVTDSIYTFETGSQIEFFSTDNGDKLRGARRDRLFMNEANNIPYEAFQQLEMRTKDFVFLDWNPTNEFWYYTELKPNRDDIEELTVTFLDNEALDEQIRQTILKRQYDKNWWKVYGLGQLGEIDARIYTGWQIIDEIPHEARLERTGIDFGYTNDPTAICDIYYYNGGYIIDEVAYQKGLTNKMIADILNSKERKALVKADKAEPKSIDEIKSYGVNILPSVGGPGSVNQGISYVRSLRISVTKRSTNFIKSYRNYLFITDKDGKITNEPHHLWSHAMDAVRYGLEDMFLASMEDEQELARRFRQKMLNSHNQTR